MKVIQLLLTSVMKANQSNKDRSKVHPGGIFMGRQKMWKILKKWPAYSAKRWPIGKDEIWLTIRKQRAGLDCLPGKQSPLSAFTVTTIILSFMRWHSGWRRWTGGARDDYGTKRDQSTWLHTGHTSVVASVCAMCFDCILAFLTTYLHTWPWLHTGHASGGGGRGTALVKWSAGAAWWATAHWPALLCSGRSQTRWSHSDEEWQA